MASLYEDDSLASEMKPDWLVGIGVNVPLLDTSGRSDKVAAAHSAVLRILCVKHTDLQTPCDQRQNDLERVKTQFQVGDDIGINVEPHG